MKLFLPGSKMCRVARVFGWFVLGLAATHGAHAADFVWAGRMGGASQESANGVAVDASGNVYTVGRFSGTVDFDPGPGTYNLTSAGVHDVFVSKFTSAGKFVWAKRLGGASDEAPSDLTVDASGNVYTVGRFSDTVDFDPGPGTYNLTSAGEYDVFVSKLTSAGNFVWAKRLGGASNETATGVAVDGSGNVYTVGFFDGTADFDPGPVPYNLTAAGANDAFVLKFTSVGNFVWGKRLGGALSDLAFDVAVDGSGHVYTVGLFEGTADFDPAPGTYSLTSAGRSDVFVSKLTSAGNFAWAERMGGASEDAAGGQAVDGSGHVYTVGSFQGTVDFDPGTEMYNLTSAGDFDVFVVRLRGISYTALGDSYSAGEGLPPYLYGTDTTINECHRSRKAYPFQIEFAGASPGGEEFIACSGVRTTNVLPAADGGQPMDHGHGANEEPQLDQVYDGDTSTRIVNDRTDMVTITIGGNDVGFASILTICAIAHEPGCDSERFLPFWPFDTRSLSEIISASIVALASDAGLVYQRIKEQAPNSAAFVLGYPRLFATGTCLQTEDALFDGSERQFLAGVATNLNDTLTNVARQKGAHFVDTLEAFRGHEVCSLDPWLFGWNTLSNQSGSFHPTSRGQREYARALDSYIRRRLAEGGPVLPSGLPANPDPALAPLVSSESSTVLSGLPSLGKLFNKPAVKAECDSRGTYVPGQAVRVWGNGFGPAQPVTVRFVAGDGNYREDVGTAFADADGKLDAVVSIPLTSPTHGDGLVEALGLRSDGGAVLLLSRIGLGSSFGSDADGDSIPDLCDNCPDTGNVDQNDPDGDGVGDACDACPNDAEDDLDRDGLCADVDPCPWDAENDLDEDGHCESQDNCLAVSNPSQQDSDDDGAGDACDAAPQDATLIAPPAEVRGLNFASATALEWISAVAQAGIATLHDVIRGDLHTLPVTGSAHACIADGISSTTADDSTLPRAGYGVWYLVRARNALGVGTYGYQSDGTERLSNVCP